MMVRGLSVLLGIAVVGAACAGAAPRPAEPSQDALAPATTDAPARSVTIGLDEDLRNLWNVVTEGGGGSEADQLLHAIHQPLTANAADGSAAPRLLQELPSVERGTWKVFSDGSMETTLKLRPNVRWHDGTAFSARDLIFSFEVFRDPQIPNTRQAVVKNIARMEALDSSTVLVTWLRTYPFADRLETSELLLLPAHILESIYANDKGRLLAHPYFNSAEYVGAGPYRIRAWEAGSHLDLVAFDDYFLGKPRIGRVRVQFIPDANTLLANLRAGAVNVTLGSKKLDRDAMRLLKQDWELSREGQVLVFPRNYKFGEPQKLHNAQPPELADVRVRRAMLHALDRQELARAVYEGHGLVADSWVHPSFRRHASVQDAIIRYPYDVRRAATLLEEVGWQRGPDNLAQKDGRGFTLAIRDFEGEKLPLMVADYWKALGVASSYEYQSPAQLQDRQARAQFTGVTLINNSIDIQSVARRVASDAIPTADNRWTGTNRGGYASAQWDDLATRVMAALDEPTRLDFERRMLQLYTTELPLLPLMYTLEEVPVGGGLTGVAAYTGVPLSATILLTWNIHEWDVARS